MTVLSASRMGLVACGYCGLVGPWDEHRETTYCPRCHGRLERRHSQSISRCWAFLLAAAILYIPANVLPVMVTESLFGVQRDTILSGIIYLWTSGSQGLAGLVFVASIFVPMAKIAALAILCLSVQRGWTHSRKQRQHLFRMVELVGRWSMLDIFVVTLMVALVRFRSLAVIEAGSGAVAFGAVVVLTMLAARSFDPRLIWDGCDKDPEDTEIIP